MGANYSFELFFPRERRWDALQAIARRVPPENPERTVVLEGGRQVTLPFANRTRKSLRSGLLARDSLSPVPLDLAGRNGDQIPQFHTSLLFECDEPIASYVRDDHPAELGSLVPIGSIGISVVNDLVAYYEREKEDIGLVFIECRAVATKMSYLFDASASIKRTFVNIAREAGGICVLFSREGREPGDDVLWLDGRERSACNLGTGWRPLAEVRRLVAEAEAEQAGGGQA